MVQVPQKRLLTARGLDVLWQILGPLGQCAGVVELGRLRPQGTGLVIIITIILITILIILIILLLLILIILIIITIILILILIIIK